MASDDDRNADPPRRGRPHLQDVSPYVPGRSAADVAREYGLSHVDKLASNENPLGPSPRALQAAAAALTEVHRYPDDTCGALRARLSESLGVPAAEIVFGHGSNELIDLLIRTACGPDDHAVIGAPSFVAYGIGLLAAGVPHTTVPLRDGLFWDLDALSAAVTPRTRLLFLDSPNNPTSTHVPASALRAFLCSLPEQVLVVVDEAYHHFVTAPDYASALSMRDTRAQLAVLRTFSKAYGLAALRVGFTVAPVPWVDALLRVRLPFNVNLAAQAAALAALDDEPHLHAYLQHNQRERDRVGQQLGAWGFAVAPSQANFLCVDLGRPATPVYELLLQQGVIVRHLGAAHATRLRISIGTTAENDRMLQALGALAAADRPAR